MSMYSYGESRIPANICLNNMFRKRGFLFPSMLSEPIWTPTIRRRILKTKHFIGPCEQSLFSKNLTDDDFVCFKQNTQLSSFLNTQATLPGFNCLLFFQVKHILVGWVRPILYSWHTHREADSLDNLLNFDPYWSQDKISRAHLCITHEAEV